MGGVRHTYTLDGTKVLRETWEENTLIPLYDSEDGVCGIRYNGDAYFFVKNLQGDVIALANMNGETVVHYTYDAWGVPTVTQDTSACQIAQINPYRYRGYYYDVETGLYYLQSRYYDPAVGRFLNADELLATNAELCSYTLYSYCGNEPVARKDINGCAWWHLLAVVAVVVTVAHIVNAAVSILHQKPNSEGENPTKTVDDQRKEDMDFGITTVAEMGCGAVAAHNALCMMEETSDLASVVRFMEAHDLTLCHYGAYPPTIALFFKKRASTKNTTKLYMFVRGNVDEKIKNSAHRIGIVGYRRGNGTGHYIAVQYCTNDDGTFKEYKAYNLLDDAPLKSSVTLNNWLSSQNYRAEYLITI